MGLVPSSAWSFATRQKNVRALSQNVVTVGVLPHDRIRITKEAKDRNGQVARGRATPPHKGAGDCNRFWNFAAMSVP